MKDNKDNLYTLTNFTAFISYLLLIIGLVFCAMETGIRSSYLFTSLLFITLVFMVYHLTRLSINNIKGFLKGTSKYTYLIASVSVALGVLIVCDQLQSRGIWVDEYTQFKASTSINDISTIIDRAAYEHQPAYSYVLSHLSYKVFGNHEIAVRLFAICSFLATLLLLPIIIAITYKNKFYTFLAALILLSLTQLKFFSIEARPFILICLFAILYILSVKEAHAHKGSILSLCSTTFLLAMTSSIQTVLLPISISLVILIQNLRSFKTIKRVILPQILAAIIMIPFIVVIYNASVATENIKNSISLAEYLGSLKHISVTYLKDIFLESWLLCLGIILSIISIPSRKKLTLTRSIIPFLVIMFLFFTYYINWNFYTRYLILLNVLVLFSLFEILEASSKKLSYFIIVLVLVAVTRDLYSFKAISSSRFQASIKTRELHQYLNANASNNDFAIMLNFNNIGYWRAHSFFSKEIYAKHSSVNYIETGFGADSVPLIPQDKFTKDSSNVFIIQRMNWNKVSLKSILKKSEILEERTLGTDLNIYKTNINSLEKWKDLIMRAYKVVPQEYKHSPLETLIFYTIREKNPEKFKKYVEQYNALFNNKQNVNTGNNQQQKDLEKIRDSKNKTFNSVYKEYNN